MGIKRTIHQRLAGAYAVTFLHVDVRPTRNVVLAFFSVVAGNDQFAFALGYGTKLDRAVDLRHNSSFSRSAGLKKFDNARQTACDVLGLGRLTGNLRYNVARLDFLTVADHQIRPHRHLVSFQHLIAGVANFKTRLLLLIGRVFHDHARLPGYLIDLFVKGHTLFQILVLNATSNLRKNCEGERIPSGQ